MIAGTHRPIVSKLIDADGVHPDFTEADFARLVPTVEIEIPDDWPLDDAGQLDADKLRAMYCEHPRFGAEDYTPPVLESP
ncbi:MAG TPA: hypothetical protein VEM38_13255 [Burkholderiales bacterium]|nr:hypothetical protein [Burkholderiales bacterium]